MITQKEIDWITKELETGKVGAIVANKTILALKNQQSEIFQLRNQILNTNTGKYFTKSDITL